MALTEARVTAFICANCARTGLAPASRLGRQVPPAIAWPATAQEVVVPCTGRIQPEHLLRAFEGGADLVCIIGCEEDNCHYLEGSCRAARRSDYVQGLLKQIGLGEERLMLFHLPGSAKQDIAAGLGRVGDIQAASQEQLSQRIGDIAAQVAQRLESMPLSPLHKPLEAEHVEISQVEEAEENED